MSGYYCDDNQCKSVKIKDIETSGKKGIYKGSNVGRDPNCFGQCKYIKPITSSEIQLSTIPQDQSMKPIQLSKNTQATKPSGKSKIFLVAVISVIFIITLSIIIIIMKKFKLSFFGAPLPPPYSAYAF